MTKLTELYPAHMEALQERVKEVLMRENMEGIVVHSGQELKVFLDDNSYPFKVNPHFKHWLPLSTAPYPLMKRKLWNDSLAIALAAKVLAEQEKLDSFTAFSCGMFANIGHLAVTRCVLQSYNKTHKAKLRETYTNRDKRLHDIFLQLDIF